MFFEQQNRESATLAFPGYVYKIGNQKGGHYPDAQIQGNATQQHTWPQSYDSVTRLITSGCYWSAHLWHELDFR